MTAGNTLELDVHATIGALRLHAALTTTSTRIAITGPSGAGKTTILRILAGLEPRATGRIIFSGSTWQEGQKPLVPAWQRRVGWVPQESLLFPHLDVRENLAFAGATPAAVTETAELLEISSLLTRAPRHLSGGERQRVALGRALLGAPRLLLLDEPFAALDGDLRARVTQRVAAHCSDKSLPYVLVTHERDDIAALMAESWSIHDGVLAREG
jgi:molybdate transport system ATP-binding protein